MCSTVRRVLESSDATGRGEAAEEVCVEKSRRKSQGDLVKPTRSKQKCSENEREREKTRSRSRQRQNVNMYTYIHTHNGM